jgi:hypothetical protein
LQAFGLKQRVQQNADRLRDLFGVFGLRPP